MDLRWPKEQCLLHTFFLLLLFSLFFERFYFRFQCVCMCFRHVKMRGKREGFWFYYIMLACKNTQKPYLSHAYLMHAIPSPCFDQPTNIFHFSFFFLWCLANASCGAHLLAFNYFANCWLGLNQVWSNSNQFSFLHFLIALKCLIT